MLGTLAAEIRLIASTPPIIATVTRPERVLLEGTELSDYLTIQQEVIFSYFMNYTSQDERRQDEAEHRRMRERELAQVSRFNFCISFLLVGGRWRRRR